MTPQEFQDAMMASRSEIREHQKQIEVLTKQRKSLIENYVKEVFDASPYNVGDRITDEKGRTWFVSGADELCNHVVLRLNPPKKDGTMSKVTYIARGEPTIYLN